MARSSAALMTSTLAGRSASGRAVRDAVTTMVSVSESPDAGASEEASIAQLR